MLFTMNAKARPDDHGMACSFRMLCLIAVLMTAVAGCASPLYRAHPELQQRKSAIRTVGLLPPLITMYEEQARLFSVNKLVPHDEWAPGAAEAVRKAFIDEAAAIRLSFTVIDGEDREANEILDLFSAVNFSIQRHWFLHGRGYILDEPFPEKVPSLDYSLGPAREMMERHGVDAVWIVTGFNLLPTAGAKWVDAGAVLFSILSGLGRHPVPALVLIKVELRAALVDKEGTILFYCKLNEEDLPSVAQNPDQLNILQGAQSTSQAAEEDPLKKDIRDPKTARRYVRTLLSEYRKAVAP